MVQGVLVGDSEVAPLLNIILYNSKKTRAPAITRCLLKDLYKLSYHNGFRFWGLGFRL